MRKTFAIALLSAAVISAPAVAASNSVQQPQGGQVRSQSDKQPASAQNQQTSQSAQNQANNQSMSTQNLSHREIRKVQQALDDDGFKAGRPDGRWGPETAGALKKFQQSKQLAANGHLDQQTVADLGLNTGEFQQHGGNANKK